MSNVWHIQASSADLTEDDDGEEDYECHTVYTARCVFMKFPLNSKVSAARRETWCGAQVQTAVLRWTGREGPMQQQMQTDAYLQRV